MPYVLGPGSRYFVQGALELLDQPGEYYLDQGAGVVYYYPRDENQLSQGISTPYAGDIVVLKGSTPNQRISHVVLEDLIIRNSDIRKDGVHIENSESVIIRDNRINNSIPIDMTAPTALSMLREQRQAIQ
ncbi:hypothetical protein GC102_21505 [Paenibacillus sp. LMG 31460]|uniref:GH141-like insertion domain-containing protein n=1 Tax=Paenibacillus germinis TaxID=2654979 RepID=A0ABX1Z578_9BACL|nr:hypothetical protein [Paenibacillus germinis]NOU88317.1 hypothetical protein [Paenibacillus germinis]